MEEKVLNVGDLGECGSVTARNIEHPIVSGLVSGVGRSAGGASTAS